MGNTCFIRKPRTCFHFCVSALFSSIFVYFSSNMQQPADFALSSLTVKTILVAEVFFFFLVLKRINAIESKQVTNVQSLIAIIIVWINSQAFWLKSKNEAETNNWFVPWHTKIAFSSKSYTKIDSIGWVCLW